MIETPGAASRTELFNLICVVCAVNVVHICVSVCKWLMRQKVWNEAITSYILITVYLA